MATNGKVVPDLKEDRIPGLGVGAWTKGSLANTRIGMNIFEKVTTKILEDIKKKKEDDWIRCNKYMSYDEYEKMVVILAEFAVLIKKSVPTTNNRLEQIGELLTTLKEG